MKASNAAELLMLNEGYRKKPYLCTANKMTIGYGRNLEDRGIDEIEARFLLERDIAIALEPLRLEPYWLGLSEVRQAVLIDMCVNLGWPRLSGFQRMRAALRNHDYRTAADEMKNSMWYTQVGERGPRLERMMREDRWP